MTPEEEADHKFALGLHAQLNNIDIPTDEGSAAGPSAASTAKQDADLALALQLQWQEDHPDLIDGDGAQPPKDLIDYLKSTGEIPDLADAGSSEEWGQDFQDEGESDFDEDFEGPTKQEVQAAQAQQAELLGALKKHEKEVLQLCEDDGALYAEDVSKTQSSRSFNSLSDWMVHVRGAKCTSCKAAYFSSSQDVIALFKDWEGGKSGCLSSQIICKHCKMFACPSCLQSVPDKISWLKVHGKKVSWCCDDGRLLLLWIILCGFDDRYSVAKPRATTLSAAGTLKRGKASIDEALHKLKKHKGKAPASGNGVGFGGGHDGYGAPGLFRRKGRQLGNIDGLTRARKVQTDEDTFGSMILKLLTGLVPVRSRSTAFDHEPPGAVSNVLLESSIFRYCTSLLRNDSLDDISTRQMVYEDLFAFVTSLCNHPMTTGLVHNDRLMRTKGDDLLTLSFQDSPGAPDEKGESVVNSARNLATQSSLLLKHAHMKDFSTGEGQSLVKLAQRINDLWQLLNLPGTNRPASPITKEAIAAPEPATDAPNDQIMAMHAYANPAKALRDPPRGRMKRLFTEITGLNTGLPPGIFVRYGLERPDVLKAVIIGPSGTPYENGIFEFDIFCGANYPNGPPQITFKTTGNGSAHFNPNLYQCGKVCLSLLGTWSGEPWKPGESTLLQVLISIQAMIFCEEPWYNEPGRERYRGNDGSASKSYNKVIQALTVQHAILSYANNPPTLWKDVVDYHFKQNANKILKTVQEWANEPQSGGSYMDDYGERYTSLSSKASQLQEAMRKYGSTYVMTTKKPSPQGEKAPPRRPSRWAASTPAMFDDLFQVGAPPPPQYAPPSQYGGFVPPPVHPPVPAPPAPSLYGAHTPSISPNTYGQVSPYLKVHPPPYLVPPPPPPSGPLIDVSGGPGYSMPVRGGRGGNQGSFPSATPQSGHGSSNPFAGVGRIFGPGGARGGSRGGMLSPYTPSPVSFGSSADGIASSRDRGGFSGPASGPALGGGSRGGRGSGGSTHPSPLGGWGRGNGRGKG